MFEVKTADFSLSPVYKAGIGLVDPGKGISLRFPRFIRVRDDKTEATSSEQIVGFYRDQLGGKGNGNEGDADDGFEY